MVSAHSGRSHERVRELLAGYAAGTVTGIERRWVSAHLDACPSCRQELGGWQAVQTGLRAAPAPAPSPGVLAGVLARIDADAAAPAAHDWGAEQWGAGRSGAGWWGVVHAAALLRGQVPLVRRRLWLASALVMVLGAAVAAAGTASTASVVLALVAPVVAAAGLAVVYGPEVDPGLELAVATPTSPRSVLLARFTVVFGYDLLLGLAASVVLAGVGVSTGVGVLVSAWLGPMMLLSALTLIISIWFGPSAAFGAALVVWTARLVVGGAAAPQVGGVGRVVELVWSTSGGTVTAAIVLLAAAVLVVPYRSAVRFAAS